MCSSRDPRTLFPIMKSVLALIITEEPALQDGLVALLTTIPAISAVLIAEDIASGMRMLGTHYPGIVVTDLALGIDDTGALINQIKQELPGTKTIVLTDSPREHSKADTLNAEKVLCKGFSPSVLITVTEELLG